MIMFESDDTSREESRVREDRFVRQWRTSRAWLRPVAGTSFVDLDRRRLVDYFVRVREQETLLEGPSAEWESLLVNAGMLHGVRNERPRTANVASLLLFGKNAHCFLPCAKIDAAAHFGAARDHNVKERATLCGPIVPLRTVDGSLSEPGLVEQAMAFVRQNTNVDRTEDGVARDIERDYPSEAVREVIVNAIAHRDYLSDAGIRLSIYPDRLEVVTPGGLPIGITPDKVRTGCRRVRNEFVKDVMRDYGYPEQTGMGVRCKVVQTMKEHNGTDPDLTAEDDQFTVTLWK